MSLGTTKKIQASIEKRPMSGALFQHLNFEEKKALKAYTSRSVSSLIKKKIILEVRLRPMAIKQSTFVIQELPTEAF